MELIEWEKQREFGQEKKKGKRSALKINGFKVIFSKKGIKKGASKGLFFLKERTYGMHLKMSYRSKLNRNLNGNLKEQFQKIREHAV